MPPSSSTRARSAKLAAALLFLVAPLLLRLAPIEHGAPRNYVEDAHMVRAALGMARDRDPIPPVGKYSTYPNLLPYALVPVYAGQFALGLVGGQWSGAEEYAAHLLERPASARVLARILVALLGALTPWVVFRAARAAGLGGGAWAAGWLVTTGLLHVHFSVQERPWVPMVLFMALASWAAAVHVRSGSSRSLILAGACAALAFSCHQAGLGALALPAFAWMLGPSAWHGAALRRRIGVGAVCVLVFLVVSVVAGHAYLLRYGVTPTGSIAAGEQLARRGGLSIGGQGILLHFRLASVLSQAKTLFGYDPLLVILALAGLVPAFRLAPARPLLLFAIVWAAFFMTHENDNVRYILPLSVLLALPAGAAVERAWRRQGAAWVLAPALALAIVPVLRLDVVMRRPDTRAEAESRLATLPAGARVAIDRYGPQVELTLKSLERTRDLRARRGGSLTAREELRITRLAALLGESPAGTEAILLEDLLETDERVGTARLHPAYADQGSADSFLAALGTTHLLLVSRWPGSARPPLLHELVAGREPVWTIDPSRTARPARETRLPMDMEFPLVDLWSVERPGPWMALYDLR